MFYLLDKPTGISSFRFIKKFAKENNIKKIGHTGTLDPAASGLLLVATNEDTKLINYIDKDSKVYKVEMKLGFKSNTFDSEGDIIKGKFNKAANIQGDIESFLGTYMQSPPSFSAKKVNGQRSYKAARDGKFLELQPVKVTISEIKDIKKIDKNTFEFVVRVSRGTYIRSLVVDIASKSNSDAYMSKLRRIEVANLDEKYVGKEIPVEQLLTIPTIVIEKLKELFQGKIVKTKYKDGLYAIKRNNDILGIVNVSNNIIKPKKLFGNKL